MHVLKSSQPNEKENIAFFFTLTTCLVCSELAPLHRGSFESVTPEGGRSPAGVGSVSSQISASDVGMRLSVVGEAELVQADHPGV